MAKLAGIICGFPWLCLTSVCEVDGKMEYLGLSPASGTLLLETGSYLSMRLVLIYVTVSRAVGANMN